MQRISRINNSSTGRASIDVYAKNYQPTPSINTYKWDHTLFYSLEDANPEISTDGNIYGYDVTKKQLINVKTDQMIEYDIYTNPDTGKVNFKVAQSNRWRRGELGY